VRWNRKARPRFRAGTCGSVVLGIDKAGYIHVSGNMHAMPMVYFRSRKPYDIGSMEPVHKMTGREESRVTYPNFFNDIKSITSSSL